MSIDQIQQRLKFLEFDNQLICRWQIFTSRNGVNSRSLHFRTLPSQNTFISSVITLGTYVIIFSYYTLLELELVLEYYL